MSADVEPDWDSLHRNPAAFFRLDPGFDLRRLKAAYAALLRRYKPEKTPDEFKKIRAAFESLKGRLEEAAGGSATISSSPIGFREPIATPRPPERRRAEPRRDDPGASASRSPRERYEALRADDARTPDDYYTLAVLSDVVAGEPGGFARWLHAGLRRHPDEPRLARLLSEYLGTDEAAANAESLLVETSLVIPNDRFYDVSRPLWERLLGAVDFATFRSLLEACEANLDGAPGECRVAFSWWVLRRAVWEPDRSWCDARIKDLESLGDDLTRWDAACHRDLVDLLQLYRPVRHKIVTHGSVRKEMDRTVIACATSGPRTADRRMVDAQAALASRDGEVLREFRPGSVGADLLGALWERLAEETASRRGIPALPGGSVEQATIREFAQSLGTTGWHPIAWVLAHWAYCLQQACKALVVMVWAVSTIPLVIISVFSIRTQPGQAIAMVAVCLAFSFAMRWLWRLLAREQAETVRNASRRLYVHVWRPRVAAFLEATSTPVGSLVKELLAISREPRAKHRGARAAHVAECLESDVGLRLVRIAARYRHGRVG